MTPLPDEPIDYAASVRVIDAVPALVRERRRREGLSTRQAAARIRLMTDGSQFAARPVSFATVSRAEAGAALSVPVLRALLVWLGTPEGSR